MSNEQIAWAAGLVGFNGVFPGHTLVVVMAGRSHYDGAATAFPTTMVHLTPEMAEFCYLAAVAVSN